VVAQPFSNIPIGDEEQRGELEERLEKAEEEQLPLDPTGTSW